MLERVPTLRVLAGSPGLVRAFVLRAMASAAAAAAGGGVGRRLKTTAERKAQRARASARHVGWLLGGVDSLEAHRGCQVGHLLRELAAALRGEGEGKASKDDRGPAAHQPVVAHVGFGKGGSGGGETSDSGDPWWQGSDPWMASADVSEPVKKKPKLVSPQVENVKKEHAVVEKVLDKNVDELLECIFHDVDASTQNKMRHIDGEAEVGVQTGAVKVYNEEEWQEAEKNKMQEFEGLAREAMAQNLLAQDGILQSRTDAMFEMVNEQWIVKCRDSMKDMMEENARLKVENAKLAIQIEDGGGL